MTWSQDGVRQARPVRRQAGRREERHRSKEPRIISTPDSKITICVIPTNEELAIARKSAAIAEAGEDTYGNVFSK